MSPKIKTQITILTRQTIVVRSLRDSFKAWCEHCCDVVLALAPDSAISVLRIPSRTLSELLESGQLHVVEAGVSPILVCCNSIATNPTETEILIEGERQ